MLRALQSIGRSIGWLLAAIAVVVLLPYLKDWIVPTGGVVFIYDGEQFDRLRHIRVIKSLKLLYEKYPVPWMGSNHFSLQVRGRLWVPETSVYSFATRSDDGIRIYIDDKVIIDNWRIQSFPNSGASNDCLLEKGYHRLRVDYFDAAGLSRFRVEWSGGPIPARTIIAAPYLRKPRGYLW